MKIRIMMLALLAAGAVLAIRVGMTRAQPGYRGLSAGNGPRVDRGMVPDWTVDDQFQHDVFTFARVRYDSWRRGGKWATDYPDSDLNFSFRLQQLTSLKVHPDGVIIELTDPRLFDYPFIYMCEPGDISLSQLEATALRRYLLNGGFMMVDDFWGEREWANFHLAMKQVFPERDYIDLPLEHEIFHNVYTLKEKPQVPSIRHAIGGRSYGITWERSDAKEVHYRAILDDKDRIMVMICHNTDLGDGWEREGEDEWYFREFSEKMAYPMGINIVTYAMTH